MSALRKLAASLLLCIGLTPAAHAGDELYLRWDNCIGDGGIYNKVFACNTNAGGEVIVGSFRLGQTLEGVNSVDVVVDITSLSSTMPSWWQYQTGGCRTGSILTTAFTPPVTSSTCLNGWGGSASGGSAYDAYPNTSGPNIGRLRIVMAVPEGYSFTATAGQEIFAFTVAISHARTTGPSACGGCSTPVCLGWGLAHVYGASQMVRTIIGSATPNNGSNVTWQPGAVATTYGTCVPGHPCEHYVTCQSVTPARESTWGSIKSLYR